MTPFPLEDSQPPPAPRRRLLQFLGSLAAAALLPKTSLPAAAQTPTSPAATEKVTGIEIKIDPETYPNGRFARLHDPEGNPIELWQPMDPVPKH